MLSAKASHVQIRKFDDGVKYVFDVEDVAMHKKIFDNVKLKIWQILPSVCGSLICIPFGLMLGWPSPTYPYLLNTSTSLRITIDQSAMIAGFLMIGNTVGAPFSVYSIFGPKYSMVFSMSLMTSGWMLMWQAQSIYWLLASRLLVGLGHGYGLGQLKLYITQMANLNLSQLLIKQISLYMFFGVALAYFIGPFVTFRQMSVIAIAISIVILFFTMIIPSTPTELVAAEREQSAKRIIACLKPEANVNEELDQIKKKLNDPLKRKSFISIFKNSALRKRFCIFAFLVFCQQYTGVPATIIYTQILFEKLGVPQAPYISILYISVFFLANIMGIFVSPKYNKRNVLFFSSIILSLIIVIQLLVIYSEANLIYWNYIAVIIMPFYVTVHTVGLGNIPVTLIHDFFPKTYHASMFNFFIMLHSMGALTITKIFQVLMAEMNLFVPFCLFLAVTVLCSLFIMFCVPNKIESVDREAQNELNIQEC